MDMEISSEFEKGWADLQQAWTKLHRLLNKDPTESKLGFKEYMDIYSIMFQLGPNHSEEMYNNLQNELKTYLCEKVNKSIESHSGRGEAAVPAEFARQWINYKVLLRYLAKLLNYLDRYFLKEKNETVTNTGIKYFREMCYTSFKEEIKDVVLKLVEREREGQTINRSVILTTLEIFWAVGLGEREYYQKDFEQPLLDTTRIYYSRKSAEWIQNSTLSEYLVQVENCLLEEEKRVEHCFDKDSKSQFLKVVEEELLVKQEERLLGMEEAGVRAFLADGKTADLGRLYRLFTRAGLEMDKAANVFKQHIESEGMELIKEVSAAASQRKVKEKGQPSKDTGGQAEQLFIQQTSSIHEKYQSYISTCFNQKAQFQKALKEAFDSFCNQEVANGTSAELIANYCDNLLKGGGGEKLTDVAMEDKIKKALELLAYITEKDMFAEFYRKKLARRLLHDKSLGDDQERSALLAMKQQCGVHFTSKMEVMVNDFQLAREKQDAFRNWLQDTKDEKLDIEMNVTVLTRGNWPTYKTIDSSILPEEMLKGVEHFEQFYKDTVKTRSVNWIFFLGTCHITAQFARCKKELVMTTAQAALLLLFNHEDELSYDDVKRRMKLDNDDATRLLHSLVCGKYKILTKVNPHSIENGKGSASSSRGNSMISKSDVYKINLNFTDKARKIRIPLPPLDEKKKVLDGVKSDRQYAIDAAVVRIMKSRKQLKQQQLIVETMQQLKQTFNPETRLIKSRIEDLIAREFLERDPTDKSMFRYLA